MAMGGGFGIYWGYECKAIPYTENDEESECF